MDPVTHLVTGVLGERIGGPWLAQDLPGETPPKGLLPFCLACAILPDVDNFFGNGDLVQYLLLHRGLTHSLVGGLILALAMALGFKLIHRRLKFLKIAALSGGLIAVHLFLDLVTSYGTQLLAPFSDARLSLGSVFIIDPFFTLVLAAAAVFTYLLPGRRVAFAAMGLFWLFAYPLTNLSMRYSLESMYADKLRNQGRPFQEIHFEPDPFTPLYWKVLVKNDGEWTLTTVKLFSPEKYETLRFPEANRTLLGRLGESAPVFKTWEWFSVYPFQAEGASPANRTVVFGDLRFASTNPVLKALYGRRTMPFSLTATFGTNGELTGYRFGDHGETLVRAPGM